MTLTEGRPAATAGTVYEVALADSDGVQVGAQQLNLSLEGDSWSVARFDGLADGSYTLSVRAPGIAPYSQKIDVKGDSSAVELYVGDLAADPQAPARIGVLVPGDVNGDGTVDDADASAIIDDIEAGAASPACDANGDGTVSLADLETAVSSFDRVAVEATVARSLPPAAVEAAPGEGTEVASGSLDEVVGADAKPVSLRASEAISDEHPVEVSFDLAKDSEQAPQLGGMVINVPPSGDHAPEAGRLLVELTDGTVREIGISRAEARAAFFRSSAPTAVIDENGTVVVDFGGQIAVKKVTLVITKTQGGTNLAEVSKVEFLNNMEERIPEPELNIPGELSAVAGSKQFSVSWKAETNVTGYELSISANGREEVKRTTGTSLSVTQFDEQKIKNGTVFTLKVRSTNGAWRSDWSGSVQVTPKAEKVSRRARGPELKGHVPRLLRQLEEHGGHRLLQPALPREGRRERSLHGGARFDEGVVHGGRLEGRHRVPGARRRRQRDRRELPVGSRHRGHGERQPGAAAGLPPGEHEGCRRRLPEPHRLGHVQRSRRQGVYGRQPAGRRVRRGEERLRPVRR